MRYNIQTNIEHTPEDVLELLEIKDYTTLDAFFDPNRGWQISLVKDNKSGVIDCHENAAHVYLYY